MASLNSAAPFAPTDKPSAMSEPFRNIPSDSLEDAVFLSSRRRDSDSLTEDEVHRLEVLETQYVAEIRHSLEQFARLGAAIRSLPGTSVPEGFIDGVRRSIAATPAVPVPRRSFGWVPVVSAIIAVCLLIAIRPVDSSRTERGIAAQSDEQVRNWNVVVVKVDSADRGSTVRGIEQLVGRHGLSLQEQTLNDHPEWLGVVLTSAPAEGNAILEGIREDVPESSIDFDPLHVANTTPDEIIAVVRKALEHPTQSELHHGRIYVTTPRIGLDSAGAPEVTEARQAVDRQRSGSPAASMAAASEDRHGKRPELTGRHRSASAPRPSDVTLVVFEFSPDRGSDSAAGHQI
jgi:hypothetical protein